MEATSLGRTTAQLLMRLGTVLTKIIYIAQDDRHVTKALSDVCYYGACVTSNLLEDPNTIPSGTKPSDSQGHRKSHNCAPTNTEVYTP